MSQATLSTQPAHDINTNGLIFDIQGHSVHDGPGTRTTVFLSGCPLNCLWCSNPEGLFRKPVMMYRESRCQCCGNCIETCPNDAVTLVDDKLNFNREFCNVCESMDCISTCYHEGVVSSGVEYTIVELMRIFQRDRQFWGSNGGVTFSGGEPLLQRNFILPMLKSCKDSYIHTCIETTSCVATDFYLEAMSYVDWAFIDIKHMNSESHKALTGVGNELILHNIKAAAQSENRGVMVPRIPVIPGLNASEENIRETAKFIADIGLDVLNLLPFHRLGESKYRQLGTTYALEDQKPPSNEDMQRFKKIAEKEGLICFTGWETPF